MRYLVTILSFVFLVPAVAADLRPIPLRGEESNLAEALESCGHEAPQVASRGAAGFLAVWLQEGNVVARRVGADGFPEGSQIAVSPALAPAGKASAVRLARTSDGNFVVAWLNQTTTQRREIQFRRLAEDGSPLASIQVAVGLGPVPALGSPALSSSPDGFFAIVWSELDTTPSSLPRLAVRGRIFNNSGGLVGGTRTAATLPKSATGYTSSPPLAVAMPASGTVYTLWARPGDHSVFQALLGQTAPPEQVYQGAAGQQDQAVAAAAVDGGVLGAWKIVGEFFSGIAVRVLRPENDPVNGADYFLPDVIGAPALAADLDGSRAVLQWAQPGQEFDTEASFAHLLDANGQLLTQGQAPLRIDVPTIDSFGPQHHLTATHLAFGPGGKLAATWQVWRENPFLSTPCDDGVATRIQTFELDEETVAPPPEPPAGPYLSSPGVPGFRYKVRLSGATAGKSESSCLPQTGCVSGALAGRTEVLLRVVGPRPNGRLWPTIVRFTTAQVEVWIEQIATGTRLYYLLPAVDPDSTELGGTVDREGFPAL